MNIQIGTEYRITSDALNVVVNKRYEMKPKEGQTVGELGWKAISFHPNMVQACQYILNKQLLDSEAENIEQLLSVIKRTQKDIEAAVQFQRDDTISDLKGEIRSRNAKLNELKVIAKREKNSDSLIEPERVLAIVDPQVESVVNG